MKLGRILNFLMGHKTPRLATETLDDFVQELMEMADREPTPAVVAVPTIQWGCPTCDGKWLCFAYSRDFVPMFCPYCGIKFSPPPASELEKARFLYERAAKSNQ